MLRTSELVSAVASAVRLPLFGATHVPCPFEGVCVCNMLDRTVADTSAIGERESTLSNVQSAMYHFFVISFSVFLCPVSNGKPGYMDWMKEKGNATVELA